LACLCAQDAFVKIVRVEGVRALWRGLTAALVLTVPANSLCVLHPSARECTSRRSHVNSLTHLTLLAQVLYALRSNKDSIRPIVSCPCPRLRRCVQTISFVVEVHSVSHTRHCTLCQHLAGLFARTVTVCFTAPLELMRTYVQSHGKSAHMQKGTSSAVGWRTLAHATHTHTQSSHLFVRSQVSHRSC
jgi:hypothetical protein